MKPDRATNVVTYILGMAFNLAIVAVVAYLVYTFAIRGFNEGSEFAARMLAEGDDIEFVLILEEDTPRAEVATRLYHAGVIANPWMFRLEMFLKNRPTVYPAGSFTLNKSMNNTEVDTMLRRPQTIRAANEITIRIQEGWTISAMADYLESLEEINFTAEEFIEYTLTGDFSNYTFLNDIPRDERRNPLEGFLFPDTYNVPEDPNPRQIIIRMLNRFVEVMDAIPWGMRIEELGLDGLDCIIIIASIIEGETGRPMEERAIISQVIHSRLASGTPLQMDITVVYALGIHRTRLTRADLEVVSPFNTHTFSGLPLGPINSPSRASIEAALWPADTDYYFFVVDYSDHSRHVFTRTWPEHDAASRRYWASLD